MAHSNHIFHGTFIVPVFNLRLLGFGLLLQTSLGLLGLSLGHLGWRDPLQPLMPPTWIAAGWVLAWGMLAAVPMLAYLVLFHYWRPAFYRPMHELMTQQLGPMFAASRWWELSLIALSAGVGEELLFRWCLLGGSAASLEPILGTLAAFALALLGVSLCFGLCHALNPVYFAIAFLAAVYLGLVMHWTGSWWVAAVAHTVFDIGALVYIKATAASPADGEPTGDR